MNAPTPPKHLLTPSRTTTVFTSGNSQAVRIPKEFQLHTKHVDIFREGDAIVLRPKPMTAAEALGDLPALNDADAGALDRAMAQIDDLLPLDEPEISPPPATRRRAASASVTKRTSKRRTA
jgi:antitoxin VapB